MRGQNEPFLVAAVLGCGAAIGLALEGAVVALGTVGFAAAELVKGFEGAVVGREVAEAGLDVEEPVGGLQRRTFKPHVNPLEIKQRSAQPNVFPHQLHRPKRIYFNKTAIEIQARVNKLSFTETKLTLNNPQNNLVSQ